MSLVLKNPIFVVSGQERPKPGCTATENGSMLELWYLEVIYYLGS